MQTEFAAKLRGAEGRLFADPEPTPDETSFQVDNTTKQYYDSPYYTLHKNDLQPVPKPSSPEPRLDLGDVLPADLIAPIAGARKIAFHAVGDTGAAKVNATKRGEVDRRRGSVADAMAADAGAIARRAGLLLPPRRRRLQLRRGAVLLRPVLRAVPRLRPADLRDPRQPRRLPSTAAAPTRRRSRPSTRSCATSAPTPGPARPTRAALVRTTMTQPGVYFTLDAPFVSIIGLYTNVLEDPGVISSRAATTRRSATTSSTS